MNVNSELYHYGVLGMKWGVRRYQNVDGTLTEAGKRRDIRLSSRVAAYSSKATENALYAESNARSRYNDSRSLSRSDRYLKKARKTANKMSDKGASALNSKDYEIAVYQNKEAGQYYVKRKASERVGSLARSAAITAGMAFVSVGINAPYTMVYLTTGPKYKLKE